MITVFKTEGRCIFLINQGPIFVGPCDLGKFLVFSKFPNLSLKGLFLRERRAMDIRRPRVIVVIVIIVLILIESFLHLIQGYIYSLKVGRYLFETPKQLFFKLQFGG